MIESEVLQDFQRLSLMIEEKDSKISDLEAKLAEKEEKIEEVKKWWAYQYNREMKNQHQEKISFCIEQLEEVKEMLQPYLRFDINLYLQTIKNIDNQIKQLNKRG